MSCTIECHIVAIYAAPKLLAAIQALTSLAVAAGSGIEEQIQVKENQTIEDEVGKKIKADYVIENAFGDRIGVIIPKEKPAPGSTLKPIEFIFDKTCTSNAKQTLDKIRQAYARQTILEQLKRKGYQKVKEERLPNGSVRIVVEKWQ